MLPRRCGLAISCLSMIVPPPTRPRGVRHLVSSAARLPREHDPDEPKYRKQHMCLLFGFCGTGYYGLQSQRAEGTPGLPAAAREAIINGNKAVADAIEPAAPPADGGV